MLHHDCLAIWNHLLIPLSPVTCFSKVLISWSLSLKMVSDIWHTLFQSWRPCSLQSCSSSHRQWSCNSNSYKKITLLECVTGLQSHPWNGPQVANIVSVLHCHNLSSFCTGYLARITQQNCSRGTSGGSGCVAHHWLKIWAGQMSKFLLLNWISWKILKRT